MNCTCAKSGSACFNCLPLHKGNCANLAARTIPHAARTTPHETAGPTPTLAGPAFTAPQPISHIDDANATLPTTNSQPAISIEGFWSVSDNHTPLQESPTLLPNNHFPHLESQTAPNPFQWRIQDLEKKGSKSQSRWAKSASKPPKAAAAKRLTLGGSGGMLPQKILEICMLSDAFWCILGATFSCRS